MDTTPSDSDQVSSQPTPISAPPLFDPEKRDGVAGRLALSAEADYTLTEAVTARIRASVEKAQRGHGTGVDSVLFNGSTFLVLFLTAAAAFVPSLGDGVPKWVAPLCAGLAGVFVAMERALGFGARWRYHREMYHGYASIVDMLDFYPAVPRAEQSKYARDIYTALYALRSRESAIPNAGANSSPT